MDKFMKSITKLSVLCATVALMASTVSNAGTVTSSQLNDHYIGSDKNVASTKDYTPNNVTANYDTHWMQVTRTVTGSTGELTVKINSNFVAYNNTSGYSFGDLFLMDAADYTLAQACTDNKGNAAFGCNEYTEKTSNDSSNGTVKSSNKWQYAFDLGGGRGSSYANNIVKTGNVKEIVQNNYEDSIRSTSSDRNWQAIMFDDRNAPNTSSVGAGTWGTDIGAKLLTMTFDISGTSLMDAAQLALRWQMTCANDIIEVVTNFKGNNPGGSTAVPEPSTVMLMLLAAFGLLSARQRKQGFKA